MKHFKLSLTAGQTIRITQPGNYIRILTATGLIDVTTTGEHGTLQTKMPNGVGMRFAEPFKTLALESSATQVIELYAGFGVADDNRPGGNAAFSAAGGSGSLYGAKTVGTSAVLIAAENTAQREILIQNLGSAAIYVGPDASISTSNAVQVAAGGAIALDWITQVYGISGTAGQDVRFMITENI